MRADDWLPISKAAGRVDRSRQTVYRWVREGRVRNMRVGRKLFVNVPDLVKAEHEMIFGRPPTKT